MLENLPDISHDKDFSGMKKINTKKHSFESNNLNMTSKEFIKKSKMNMTATDKDKWFKTNKENFYHEGSVEKVDYHQDVI